LAITHLLELDSLHRGKGRQIQPGQKIHASVAFSPSNYCPKAVLPKGESALDWEHLIRLHGDTQFEYPKDWEGWLEMDIFDLTTAQTVVNNLESSSVDLPTSLHRLTVMTQSGAFFTWSVISHFSADDVHNSAGGCDALRGVTKAANRVFLALQRHDIKGDMHRQVEILNALIAFATEIPG
jgi:hypothetical protein